MTTTAKKMMVTASNSLSSFNQSFYRLKSDLKFLVVHAPFVLRLAQRAYSTIKFHESFCTDIEEIFEGNLSNPDAKWESKNVALFVAIVCILNPEGVSEWVSGYKTGCNGSYTHPEHVDEFMSVYGRYFEQFGFKPKSDNDGGDDGESSPKTPSPDLLSV
jgi:hypothetical protein